MDSSFFGAGVKNPFAPAGLDIGGEAPEKIVLSIVSEVAAAGDLQSFAGFRIRGAKAGRGEFAGKFWRDRGARHHSSV